MTDAHCARRPLALLLAAALLAGCDAPLDPAALAATLRAAPPEQVFQGSLSGEPVHLVVQDCEVFRAHRVEGGLDEAWTRVLAPRPYPLPTACERQSLSAEGGRVTVTLGRRAFGAGGCCASGGTFQSTEGWTWKKIRD